MSGDESDMSRETRAFGKALEERSGLPVVFFDERLTSMMAENAMREDGMSRKKQKAHTDQVSASILLQGYLNTL